MSVADLVVAEQFYAVVPEEMAVRIKDRKPDSLERMAELADDYMLSRKGVGSAEGVERQGFGVWRSDLRQGGGINHGGNSGGINN